jgi:hypothetical protein
VRAYDQPGADGRRPPGEDLLHDLLASDLELAVPLAHVLALVLGVPERRAFVVPLRERLGVGGDARDEDVVVDGVAQQLGRGADDAGQVARRVDDRVPRAAFERAQVAVAIAAQLLGLREQLGVRLAAVEERDLVALLERVLDDGTAEELRPAEDEQPHAAISSSAASRPSTSSSVL